MNKFFSILVTTLCLMVISGQASAHYWRNCNTWWKNGVKYTNCYKSGHGYVWKDHRGYGYYNHGHRGYHGGHYEHRHGAHHHGHHSHHGHHR